MSGNRVWIVGSVIAIVVVLALGWLLGASPLLQAAALADSDRASVQAQNNVQEAVLAQLRAKHDRIGQLEAELAELRQAVPSEVQIEDFIDLVDKITTEAGGKIETITVAEPLPYGADGAGTDPATSTSADAETAEGTTPANEAGPVAVPVTPPAATASVYSVFVRITVFADPLQATLIADELQKSSRYYLMSGMTFNGADSVEEARGVFEGYLLVVPEASANAGTPVEVNGQPGVAVPVP